MAHPGYILGGLLTALAWLVVRAFFWRSLLQGQAPLGQIFLTLNEGYLLNNVLPFRLGEVGRAFLLGRKTGLDFWQVISSILLERALDLLIAVGLFLGTLSFVMSAAWGAQAAIGIGIVVLIGLASLFLLARYRAATETWLTKMGQRWSWIERLVGGRVSAFLNGLGVLTHPLAFLRSIGWLLLDWGLGWLQYLFLLRAFFPEAQPLWAAFGLGAGALGLAAPSTPGGIGVYEWVLMTALAAFTQNREAAAAFAFLTHAINYLFTGLLGGYALFRDGETLTSLYRAVSRLAHRQPTPPS